MAITRSALAGDFFRGAVPTVRRLPRMVALTRSIVGQGRVSREFVGAGSTRNCTMRPQPDRQQPAVRVIEGRFQLIE